MTKIIEVTLNNYFAYADSLTMFPGCWHAFVMHRPTTSGNNYDAENWVVSYVFAVGSGLYPLERVEIWIKGADGAPPYVYVVYQHELYYLPRFSLDYSKCDSQGLPTVETEFTKDSIVRFLEEEFFDERELARREYRTPEFRIETDI